MKAPERLIYPVYGEKMTDSKKASELAAELAEVLRELPDDEVAAELRALRTAVEKLSAESVHCHSCCHHGHCNWGHCNCLIWHFSNATVTVTQPNTWTSISSGTSTVYTVT